MVQGWKKVHGMNSHIPKGASFGVKLENAPPGVTNEVSNLEIYFMLTFLDKYSNLLNK